MAVEEITITQTNDPITKCFVRNGAWFDRSAEAITIGGTPFDLWADEVTKVYIGKATKFAYVGFSLDTPGGSTPGYGTFTIEYSTSLNITGVNQGLKQFTIAESMAPALVEDVTFWIEGSTGNDGMYTVDSSGATTIITVKEAIPDATVDGAIMWISLTVIANNVQNFKQNGFLAWAFPLGWSAESVNGSDPFFWIRAYQSTAAPGVTATANHLMRNLTLGQPLHVEGPVFEIDRYYRDINGVMRLRDMTYNGPTRYTVGITQIACTNLNKQLLYDWQYYKHNLYIQDEAFVGTGTSDCYYHTMTGRLIEVPPQMQSPYKMGLELNAYYPLVFQIDSVLTLSTALGLSA